jgi:hypothetical protein
MRTTKVKPIKKTKEQVLAEAVQLHFAHYSKYQTFLEDVAKCNITLTERTKVGDAINKMLDEWVEDEPEERQATVDKIKEELFRIQEEAFCELQEAEHRCTSFYESEFREYEEEQLDKWELEMAGNYIPLKKSNSKR